MKSGRGSPTRSNRRIKTFAWFALFSIVTIALLYWEKIAILYIVTTLALSALLVVVAMADLSAAERASGQTAGVLDTNAAGKKSSP
jgi:hypothetical protein